MQRYEIDVAN
jgi:hypothetical protein